VCFLGLTLNGQLYLRFLVYYFSSTKKEIWTFKLFLGNRKGGFFPTLFSLLLSGISWYVCEIGVDGLVLCNNGNLEDNASRVMCFRFKCYCCLVCINLPLILVKENPKLDWGSNPLGGTFLFLFICYFHSSNIFSHSYSSLIASSYTSYPLVCPIATINVVW